jgi:catalase
MVYMIANIDRNLAKEVAEGIGVENVDNETAIKEVAKDAMPRKKGRRSIDHSPVLSQEKLKGTSIKGRKVAILIDHGFNYQSVKGLQEMLSKNGAMAEIVSKFHGKIKSDSGDVLETDKSHVTTGSIMYDAVFIPGGTHVELLKKQGDVLHFINEAYKHCKAIGLIAEAIELLKISSVKLDNESFANSGVVHENMGVVTAWKNENVQDFLTKFENAIRQHRHWTRAANKEMVPA